MPPYSARSNAGAQEALSNLRPSIAFVVMIFGALIAFEVFNYSTTDHALRDLLGDLKFVGIHWATILALAFCGIDFAGIARLFTPEQGAEEPKEVWYLFGAWLLAATMNAILTWWGVSMAVVNHAATQSSSVIDPKTMTTVVPVFVAIMVWVIRILIIGTLSLAMDRLLHPTTDRPQTYYQNAVPVQQPMPASQPARARTPVQPTQPMNVPAGLGSTGVTPRPSMSRAAAPSASRYNRGSNYSEEGDFENETPGRSHPEPTYHSISMSNRPAINNSRSNDQTGPNRFRKS